MASNDSKEKLIDSIHKGPIGDYDIKGESSNTQQTNEEAPPEKKKWSCLGCGCIVVAVVVVAWIIFSVVYYMMNKDEIDSDLDDPRIEYLREDISKAKINIDAEQDSISSFVQLCVKFSIEGIDTDDIKYYSKQNDNKLLMILKVSDMKGVEASSRKQLVYAVEECLDGMDLDNIDSRYIAVDGNWNMLMVKTPYESDLGGKFASESLLYSFYDEPLTIKSKDSLNIETIKDSID